jgi:four helix bundle protein
MTIKRFEDIDAWQEARVLTKEIYRLTKLSKFSKDWGLREQIQRASVSIMNNIAEGFDCGTKAEFIKFLGYSRRSASEVQCILYVALDQGYIMQNHFEQLYDRAEKVRRMVTSFIRYLKKVTF